MSQPTPRPVEHYHKLVQTFPSMAGKTVLITGCTSGTGLVLARTCGKLGATVVMLNRPSARADKALKMLVEEDKAQAVFVPCDLQSYASVRAAGKTLREKFRETGCDVLCNNAGVMALPDTATPDGFDVQMQSNHLSHFLLTSEVWPLLVKAAELRGEARVVNHSSGARRIPPLALSAKHLGRNGGHLGGDGFPGLQKWVRYQQSKLANILFTYALHEQKEKRQFSKIKILTAHPGPTATELQGKASSRDLVDRLILDRAAKIAHSVEDGTSGIARCCCEAGVESTAFYGPAGQSRTGPAVLLPPERNPKGEALLWDESMKATGIADFFAPKI